MQHIHEEPRLGPFEATASTFPDTELAATYQPRRIRGAAVSVAWNLLCAAGFVLLDGPRLTWQAIAPAIHAGYARFAIAAMVYLAGLFIAQALINFPLDLWFGYLQARQFGLEKDGVRAWARDWLVGVAHHALRFVAGALLIVSVQAVAPGWWIEITSVAVLLLFAVTTRLALHFVPHDLFEFEPADATVTSRLESLVGNHTLPPIVLFGAPAQREFTGGIIGLGSRQVLLISRSTIELASDAVLRFTLLHELGHRRGRHLLIGMLMGWSIVTLGLYACRPIIPAAVIGQPSAVPYLALAFSAWMAAALPLLAWLGRRLEYAADRFYLRANGTVSEMHAALIELSARDLVRNRERRIGWRIVRSLPTVGERITAARAFQSNHQ